MKRRQFVRALERAACQLKRSSGRHDIYYNPAAGRSAPVPRHSEIPDSLCRLIMRQLDIHDRSRPGAPVQ